MKTFYRYEMQVLVPASYDMNGEFAGSLYAFRAVSIRCIEFNLHKETPKSWMIGYGDLVKLHSKSRRISKTSKKKYAYPTKKEALESFMLRTKKRLQYLNNDVEDCTLAIKKATIIQKEIESI
jgi:hypothetical protein